MAKKERKAKGPEKAVHGQRRRRSLGKQRSQKENHSGQNKGPTGNGQLSTLNSNHDKDMDWQINHDHAAPMAKMG